MKVSSEFRFVYSQYTMWRERCSDRAAETEEM